jgi:alpha-tubulin suppressor-like RCC1 family protein
LGLGHTQNIFTPVVNPNLHGVKTFFLGLSHSVCVGSQNTVFAFGKNSSGQLGFGDRENRINVERIQNVVIPGSVSRVKSVQSAFF